MDLRPYGFFNAKDEKSFLSSLDSLCREKGIEDFLIVYQDAQASFYASSFTAKDSFFFTQQKLDWKRIALKENELYWHIDMLLYDIQVDENTVLPSNRNYIIYTTPDEDLVFFAHYKEGFANEKQHKEFSASIPEMRMLVKNFLLERRALLLGDIQEKINTINKKTFALQQLALLLQSTLNLDKILEIITKSISDSLDFSVVLLSLYDEKEDVMIRAAQYGLADKVFEKLKKQRVSFSTLKNLIQDKYRISKSYYIKHNESGSILNTQIGNISYILPDEKPEQYINWHPEDILIIPLYSKDDRIIGIITVDKPVKKYVQINESVELIESFAQTAALAIENARLFNNMQNLINNIEKINEISSTLTQYTNLQDMLDHLVTGIKEKFNYFNVAVLMNDENNDLKVRAFSGFQDKYIDRIEEVIKSGDGIVGWVMENGISAYVKDTRLDPRYVGRLDIPFSEISIPIKISGNTIGVLNVESEGVYSLDENDFRILSILTSHLSTAIDNTFKYEETEKIAVTDVMTGMYNYRYFINRLRDEIERAKNLGIPLSLIMIDVDYFKEINDTYGHIVGDKIIKELADLLKNIVRKGDIVTRYGGDEFFIILPGSGKTFTSTISKRIVDEVKGNKFTNNINLTLSLGTVTYPEDAEDVDALLKWVDNALYDAKRRGRDRINN